MLLSCGVFVRRDVPLSDALAATGAEDLQVGGEAPYTTLRGDVEIDGTYFVVMVTFEDERAASVSLAAESVGEASWSDHDPVEARAFHDGFLAERLGPGRPWQPEEYPYGGVEYDLRWGTLGSYLHPQDQNAHILLHYR